MPRAVRAFFLEACAPCYPGPAGDATPRSRLNSIARNHEIEHKRLRSCSLFWASMSFFGNGSGAFRIGARARIFFSQASIFFPLSRASVGGIRLLCSLRCGFLCGLRPLLRFPLRRCCGFRGARLRVGFLAAEAAAARRRGGQQLAAHLERDGLRIRVLRNARIALAVGDVRAVAAVQHLDVVDAEVLDDAVGVRFLLEADDLERALQLDRVGIVRRLQRDVLGAVLDVRTEAADVGTDRLAFGGRRPACAVV